VHIALRASKSAGAKGDVPKISGIVGDKELFGHPKIVP
jgi:hypothetical protein